MLWYKSYLVCSGKRATWFTLVLLFTPGLLSYSWIYLVYFFTLLNFWFTLLHFWFTLLHFGFTLLHFWFTLLHFCFTLLLLHVYLVYSVTLKSEVYTRSVSAGPFFNRIQILQLYRVELKKNFLKRRVLKRYQTNG